MIVSKLEESIDNLMSALSEAADIQVELDNAKSEIAMFSMLYDINQYINTNLEIKKLIPLVEDVVLGIVGANYCAVVLEELTKSYVADYGIKLTYQDLLRNVTNTIFVHDLSEQPMLGLDKGCLYINKMDLADDTCGYMVVYWTINIFENDKKVQFLSILSTQVGLTIKNAKLMEKLTSMALHDPLTGIYNRSMLNNMESSVEPKIGECTVMFDIDNFKKINDTNGHNYGDKVLKEFANILNNTAKEANASCFRYGGEEFVLKCDGDEWEGLRLANIVREHFSLKTGYTVSAGVAAIGESCKLRDYKSLIELADAAMYVSKQSGKNRVTISNSDLQLYEKTESELHTLLDKIHIHGSNVCSSTLLRLDIISNCIFSLDEFDLFKKRLIDKFSEYKIYITQSLSAFLITEVKSDYNKSIQQVKELMKEHYPELDYTIYECNSIFDEVAKHSRHVADLVRKFGPQLNMSEEEIDSLVNASNWHDVGKLCIDPAIYSKPGKLTDSEYDRIKYHAWLGYSIAKHSQKLKYCSDWILKHHEDCDGKGYYGYKGEDIPMPAQILSILDKFDALTEDRCYRKAYSFEEALAILQSESYKFDTELFERFLTVVPKTCCR